MNVKKSLIVSAVVALPFVASSAFAADNFTGFSAGIGVGATGSNGNMSSNGASADLGKTTTVGLIDLAYNQQLDSQWGIGVGGTYDFNKTKFGTVSATGLSVNFDGKEHYSVYLQPYYLLTPKTALFAKVGYNSIKGEASGDVSGSERFHGVGYGLGLKTFISPNVYLQAEANWVDYGSKTEQDASFKPKTVAGILSIGYKF